MRSALQLGLVKAQLVVVLVLAGGASASPPSGLLEPRARSDRAPLQTLLDSVVRASAPPGIAAYVRDRDGTWQGASGLAALDPDARMRSNAHVRIASVTKTFTATVVLQLVGERKLRLRDTVERWLPGLVPDGRRITVQHLLIHTSGIPDFDDPPGLLAPRAVIAAPLSQQPLFAPGSRFSYSSTNYILLGLIVEAATRSTFASQLRRRVLAPLKLTQTTFERRPADTAMPTPFARGYDLSSASGPRDVTSFKGHWASGGVVSTVADVGRFYAALFGGKLLGPRLLRQMLTTRSYTGYPGGAARYGLGIRSVRLPCGVAWGHDGDLPGYGIEVYSSRNGARQVVVAYNTSAYGVANRLALGAFQTLAFCGG